MQCRCLICCLITREEKSELVREACQGCFKAPMQDCSIVQSRQAQIQFAELFVECLFPQPLNLFMLLCLFSYDNPWLDY